VPRLVTFPSSIFVCIVTLLLLITHTHTHTHTYTHTPPHTHIPTHTVYTDATLLQTQTFPFLLSMHTTNAVNTNKLTRQACRTAASIPSNHVHTQTNKHITHSSQRPEKH